MKALLFVLLLAGVFATNLYGLMMATTAAEVKKPQDKAPTPPSAGPVAQFLNVIGLAVVIDYWMGRVEDRELTVLIERYQLFFLLTAALGLVFFLID